MAKTESPPLTVGQVAHRLELSVRRVRDLIDQGKLTCTRAPYPPYARLISLASVEALETERAARA